MEIAVLVKQVPDTNGERRLDEATWLLDRSTDGVVDEIDARGVETALQLAQTHGGSVTVLTMGPEAATDALRKVMAMGADRAVHVIDDALSGSDAMATSAVLAAALRTLSPDLVIAGNEATDGRTASIPAMLAERLGLPAVTSARSVSINGSTVTAERVVEGAWMQVSASLPAVVSVHEKIGDPRYPTFKGIMAAKKKAVTTMSVADLGLPPAEVGLGGAAVRAVEGARRPPRSPGQKVVDAGTGGSRIVEFLSSRQLI